MTTTYSSDYIRQSDIDIKTKVSKLIEKENSEERRVELGLMLEISEMFTGLKNALVSSIERIDKEHLAQKERIDSEHIAQAEKLNRLSVSLLEHIEATNALMNKAKGARYTIPVLIVTFGLTGSLIGILYHNMTKTIENIQAQHNVLMSQQNTIQSQQTSIQTQQLQIMTLINDLKTKSNK